MLNAQGQPARELVKFRSTHSTKGVRRDKRNTGRSTAKQYSDSPNPVPVYPSWLQTTPKYQNWWESPESTMPVQIWRLPNSKEHRHVGKWQLLCQSLEPTESELQHVAPTSSIWGNENGQELVRREMSSNVKHSQIIFDSVQEKLKSFHPPRSGLVGNEQTDKNWPLSSSKRKDQVTCSQTETLLAASSVLLRRRFAPRSAEMEWKPLSSQCRVKNEESVDSSNCRESYEPGQIKPLCWHNTPEKAGRKTSSAHSFSARVRQALGETTGSGMVWGSCQGRKSRRMGNRMSRGFFSLTAADTLSPWGKSVTCSRQICCCGVSMPCPWSVAKGVGTVDRQWSPERKVRVVPQGSVPEGLWERLQKLVVLALGSAVRVTQ